jgi:uncharacterized repeat protein (TIGR01451 family)
LQLRTDIPRNAPLHEWLKFKLVVTNTGKAAAKNVVIEDTLSDGWKFMNCNPSTPGDKNPLTWSLGDIAPGASRTIEIEAIANELGTLTSRAVARADGGLVRESKNEVRIGKPLLTVAITGPKQRFVGRPATYVITVTNTGTWQAEEVELSDELPDPKKYADAITFVRATEGGRQAGNRVRWNLGTILPGQRRSVLVELRSKQAGKFENVCHVQAKRGLNEQDAFVTEFEAGAALTVETERNRSYIYVGQEAEFTVRVFNGSKAAETGVSVVATVPEGLQILNFKTTGQKISFPVITNLAPGGEQTATIRVRALKAGEHRLQVGAATNRTGPDHPVAAEEILTVLAPGKKEPK